LLLAAGHGGRLAEGSYKAYEEGREAGLGVGVGARGRDEEGGLMREVGIQEAIDRMLEDQEPRAAWLTPGDCDAPAVEVSMKVWEELRAVARLAGVTVADRGEVDPLKADCFAAALRNARGLSASGRRAGKAVLDLVRRGAGLSVRLAKPAAPTSDDEQVVAGRGPGRVVLLGSANDPDIPPVKLNDRLWAAVGRLARDNGYAVSHELLLAAFDAICWPRP
jgi:hypothetical protein